MRHGTAVSYRVFARDWWRVAGPHEPDGFAEGSRMPYPGAPKHTLARGCTYEEARELCSEYAATHEPGPMSRKAEFEEE